MEVLGVSHRLSEEELFDFSFFQIMIIRKNLLSIITAMSTKGTNEKP